MKPVSGQNRKRGPARGPVREAAEAAGITRQQAWQWIQLANIPESTFEALIETDNPPSVSQLVEIARVLQGKPPSKPRPRRLKHCPHCGENLTLEGTK